MNKCNWGWEGMVVTATDSHLVAVELLGLEQSLAAVFFIIFAEFILAVGTVDVCPRRYNSSSSSINTMNNSCSN